MLKDAQHKAQHAAMPIAYVQLPMSNWLLSSPLWSWAPRHIPCVTEDSWMAKAFRAVHITRKRQLLACGTTKPFGGAHAASTHHVLPLTQIGPWILY